MTRRLYAIMVAACVFGLGACSDGTTSEQQNTGGTASGKAVDVKVLRWAPHSTTVGQGFNEQANGKSSIWFEISGLDGAEKYEVWFGSMQLSDVFFTPGKIGSAIVPASLLERPGKFSVYILSRPSGAKYALGTFEVLPK